MTAETAARAPIQRLSATTARGNTSRRRWADDAATPRLKYRAFETATAGVAAHTHPRRAEILEKCIRSILTLTRYRPYEIIIVDNDSRGPATRRLFERCIPRAWCAFCPRRGNADPEFFLPAGQTGDNGRTDRYRSYAHQDIV
jgi:hypothetical protein